jgi:hypothetical protein
MRHIAREIKRIAWRKLVRHAVNDESHLTFENVNDLLLRMRVRRHATPGFERCHHLIHRLPVGNRLAGDPGTNFNRRIFSFHLQNLTVQAAACSRKLSQCQPQKKKNQPRECYDNVKKKFVGSWIDNMGTGIMFSKGTYDPTTKTFTYTSEFEAIPGVQQKIREVIKVTDKDHHTLEWYEDRGGTEVKTMEIAYTRAGKK